MKNRNIWLLLFLAISFKINGQVTLNINKLDDAVGIVLCYDVSGNYLGHGSCFLIDSNGILVTNYHVLEDVYAAKIKLEDGNLYDLDKIIYGNKVIDLMKFSIKKKYINQKFPFVKVAKSLPIKGEHAWAIGTPYKPELMNTVSEGLVSNISSETSITIIQTNAEITNGSSGGALFNSKGEAIGVTTSGYKNIGANLNFAIWIGELNNLNYLNVVRIYNDALIPVKVSFYITYISYSNDVSLYIDSKYMGTFSSYFGKEAPDCGQLGTITTYLSKGYHSFYAHERTTGISWSGDFTINTNDCFRQGLNNTPPTKQLIYTPKTYIPRSPEPPRKEIKNVYKWMLSAGYSTFRINTDATSSNNNTDSKLRPLSIDLERYFSSHKISLRANYQYLRTNQKYSTSELTNYGLKYSSFGLDFKRIFTKEEHKWNWYIAGSVNVRTYIKDYSQVQFLSNGVYQNQYIESVKYSIGFAPLFKTGAEMRITKRFCLSWDSGIGYNTASMLIILENNFILGYRLFANKND